MPDPTPPSKRPAARSVEDRAGDHAAIDRLAAELLPALVAKLGATGLGELDVREGPWRVRLRRPAGPSAGPARDRRGGERDRGEHRGDRHPERPGRGAAHAADRAGGHDGSRRVATSPAVGIFHPRTDLVVGDRVRVGDRLGAVDMLGVPQDVLAPIDGVLGAGLVESGDAVEYGQELLVVETISSTAPLPTDGSDGAV